MFIQSVKADFHHVLKRVAILPVFQHQQNALAYKTELKSCVFRSSRFDPPRFRLRWTRLNPTFPNRRVQNTAFSLMPFLFIHPDSPRKRVSASPAERHLFDRADTKPTNGIESSSSQRLYQRRLSCDGGSCHWGNMLGLLLAPDKKKATLTRAVQDNSKPS